MLNNEKIIDYLETQIPELAELAVTQAYWNALASGSTVLEVENDTLVEKPSLMELKNLLSIYPHQPK